MASAAACRFREGRPPTAFARSFRVNLSASATVLPTINSVKTEPHTKVGGQPYARNRAASILLS